MTPVSVEVIGFDKAMEALEKKFGEKAAKRMMRYTLKEQQKVMVEAFQDATATYSNGSGHSTGATHDEVIGSSIRITGNGATSEVGFNGQGSEQRWRLVHLNELGYSAHGVFAGHNNAQRGGLAYVRPRGFGKLEDAWKSHQDELMEMAQSEIRKELGL